MRRRPARLELGAGFGWRTTTRLDRYPIRMAVRGQRPTLRCQILGRAAAVSALPSSLRLVRWNGQVFEDRAIDCGSANACRFATAHEGAKAGFQRLEFVQLAPHLEEVQRRDITHLCAGPIRLIDKTHQFAHLIDREAEVPAPPDERKAANRPLIELPLTSLCPVGRLQKPNVLVVADGGYRATGLAGNKANRKSCVHDAILVICMRRVRSRKSSARHPAWGRWVKRRLQLAWHAPQQPDAMVLRVAGACAKK